MSALHCGDNLLILRDRVASESVDLIYLDPPFNSRATYKISETSAKAFGDTWRWGDEADREFGLAISYGSASASDALRGLRVFLKENGMMAYLSMMAVRLLEFRRVLRSTGTVYLHCDPSASHYLKILLDAVFGPENFRNELVWCYAGGGIPKKDFPRKHDVILRYTKTGDYIYNPLYRPYSPGTTQRGRTKVKGKYFGEGLRKDGTPVNDWWADLGKITSPTDREKTGYPTQKPIRLLERIISASSTGQSIVLDPFCGSGTALCAAQKLGRQWIGIDISPLAISCSEKRLCVVVEGWRT